MDRTGLGPSAQRADLNFCVRGWYEGECGKGRGLSPGTGAARSPNQAEASSTVRSPFTVTSVAQTRSNACHHGHRYSCGGGGGGGG